jgi:hypothetical protein
VSRDSAHDESRGLYGLWISAVAKIDPLAGVCPRVEYGKFCPSFYQMHPKIAYDTQQESICHETYDEIHKLLSIFSMRQQPRVQQLPKQQLPKQLVKQSVPLPPPEKFKRTEKMRMRPSLSPTEQRESILESRPRVPFHHEENTCSILLVEHLETMTLLDFASSNKILVKMHQQQ